MKKKILVLAITSLFTLGSQANFFDSGHNWNNPLSVAIDTAKEAVKEVKDVMQKSIDSAVEAVDVVSLRGSNTLEDMSIAPEKVRWIKKGVEFERNFDDQPPLIPHKTESMTVNLKKNKCLSCHSDENYKEEESPKMSSTHFFNRDDKRLSELSPRRYFCLQCHVPQAKKEQLVGNNFINLDN